MAAPCFFGLGFFGLWFRIGLEAEVKAGLSLALAGIGIEIEFGVELGFESRIDEGGFRLNFESGFGSLVFECFRIGVED